MTIKINGTNTTAQPSITGADTDTGLVYGTDQVQVVTGGTTRATVDSSGRVGIGTTSPAANAKLDVNGSVNISPNTAGKETFRFATNAVDDGRLLIKSNTTTKVDIQANGTSSFNGGNVQVGGNPISGAANGSVALSDSGFIAANSNAAVPLWRGYTTGNSTQTSSILANGSAQFAGSVSIGGTAAANTIDEYEEGTWTPTLSNLSLGSGTIAGNYTKVGRMVHLNFRIDFAANSSFTGAMNGISGFPFASAHAANQGIFTASNPNNNWFGWTQQYAAGTGSNFIQWDVGSTNNAVGSNSTPFAWGSSTIMRFSMSYMST